MTTFLTRDDAARQDLRRCAAGPDYRASGTQGPTWQVHGLITNNEDTIMDLMRTLTIHDGQLEGRRVEPCAMLGEWLPSHRHSSCTACSCGCSSRMGDWEECQIS